MAKMFDLACRSCGKIYPADGYHLLCTTCGRDAFLFTRYRDPYQLRGDENSFSSYSDWLPFTKVVGEPGPLMATIRAPELGDKVGLDDLWITISGFVPEVGAEFATGTFKETEALGVLSRVKEQTDKVLIISSAGNAARAFLEHSIRLEFPMIIVIPESASPEMMVSTAKSGGREPLLIRMRDAVFMDAIRFVDSAVAEFPDQLVLEGGAFNVGRRDAMGVIFLHAVRRMGSLPRWYVQAVGSGTGAVAAWEASKRLAGFGMAEDTGMHCLLVQNEPFTPMVDAWNAGSRRVVALSEKDARERLAQVRARVLSNAQPPYAVRGGVYDTLTQSRGAMASVNNKQIDAAAKLAHETLGFTPCPAASAAMAGLCDALKSGRIRKDERVMLHLTGAGLDKMTEENGYHRYERGITIEHLSIADGLRSIGDYLRAVT
jgi:cysteate synthase